MTALASASEVATVEIRSRHKDYVQTWAKVVKDGKILRYGPSLAPRTCSGTTITIRDLFSKLPVRLKSSNPGEIREQVQRAVETIILVWPQMSLTLTDRAQQRKLVLTRKANSMLSTFRQIFGSAISQVATPDRSLLSSIVHFISSHRYQHLSHVDISKGHFRISGLVSSRGYPSKALQFIYVNAHALITCEVHKRINKVFAMSDLCRTNDTAEDPVLSMLTEQTVMKMRSSREKKTTFEKYGIYVLNISCPPSAYDLLLDPSKCMVEFADWDAILSLIELVVTDFLEKCGLLANSSKSTGNADIEATELISDETSTAFSARCGSLIRKRKGVDSSNESNLKYPRADPESLGVRGDIDWRREFAATDASHVGCENAGRGETQEDPEVVFSSNGIKYLVKRDQIAGGSLYYVDARTGNSRFSTLPGCDAANPNRVHKPVDVASHQVDRSHLRKTSSSRVGGIESSWARDALSKWRNPVFAVPERSIATVSGVTNTANSFEERLRFGNSASNLGTRHSSHYFNANVPHKETETAIDKAQLGCARVIAQVDGKFIVCVIPNMKDGNWHIDQADRCRQESEDILLIVDQHAADERRRLEKLWHELISDIGKNGAPPCTVNNKQRFPSTVATLVLSQPIKVTLSLRELAAVDRYRACFERWGISFDMSDFRESSSRSEQPETPHSRESELNWTQKNSDFVTVKVLTLPKTIADRCITEPRMAQELVRGYLQQLEVNKPALTPPTVEPNQKEPGALWSLISQSPRGLRDLMNSKACRGAIMFGDKLGVKECENLINELKDCDFPFSCAHGRPSMVPLITLSKVRELMRTTRSAEGGKGAIVGRVQWVGARKWNQKEMNLARKATE
ncbi:DNA mismatch repair protein [Gonapodya sp. JEL0774]|nr:DNA mismatch repair protein [Gonapodya sp. JEL0774]